MSVTGLLLCGGSGSRMGFDKLLAPLGGSNALERSARLLLQGGCERLVAVTAPAAYPCALALSRELPLSLCLGGESRFASAVNGLALCPDGKEDVLVIHDGARCFTPPAVVKRCIDSALSCGSGVAALPISDTVMEKRGDSYAPVDRSGLLRIQTPQAFLAPLIKKAYALSSPLEATDDSTLYLRRIGVPVYVEGDELSRKLTTPADWAWARSLCLVPRTGLGFDTHVLAPGRRLVIGGVEIPFEKGLLAHSDGDVLLHALMDALLGAAALGDIGRHFPDKDPAYLNISSRVLLRQVGRLLEENGFSVAHIDATVIAEAPKLNPYFPQARQNIGADLNIPADRISLKATTTENMNDEGRGLCISAQAVASLQERQ